MQSQNRNGQTSPKNSKISGQTALVTQQRYQRGGRQKLKWGHVA